MSLKVRRIVTNNSSSEIVLQLQIWSSFSHITLVELLSCASRVIDQTLQVDVIKAESKVSREAWCQTQERGWERCCDLDLIYFNHGFPSLQSTPNQPFSAALPLSAPVVTMLALSQPCMHGYLSDFSWRMKQLSGVLCCGVRPFLASVSTCYCSPLVRWVVCGSVCRSFMPVCPWAAV